MLNTAALQRGHREDSSPSEQSGSGLRIVGYAKRFEGDCPLLSRRPGSTQCRRCGKPWCAAPRGTDAPTLVLDPVWISQKRARQMVSAALPDLLAWNRSEEHTSELQSLRHLV